MNCPSMYRPFLGQVIGIGSCLLAMAFSATVTADIVVDFEGVAASGTSVTGADLDNYLATFGITISNVSPSGYPEIHDANDHGPLSGFPAGFLTPPSGTNFLSHGDGVAGGSANAPTNAVIAYQLNFSTLQSSVGFTRIGVNGGLSADWMARALDIDGNTIDSVGEPLAGGTPQVTFLLNGPGIASLVIERTNFNFVAGVNTVFIDDLVLTSVPEPSGLTLAALISLFGIMSRCRRNN